MTKGYLFFTLASLGGAIAFYGSNAFLSLVCFLLFVGSCYGAGKLG